MFTTSKRKLAVLVAATALLTPLLVPPTPAYAVSCAGTADTTWLADQGRAWENPSNWSNGVPANGVAACITDLAGGPIVTTTAASGFISAEPNSMVTVDTGGTLVITGDTQLQNLTLTGTGRTTQTSRQVAVLGDLRMGGGQMLGTGNITVQGRTIFTGTGNKSIAPAFAMLGPADWSGAGNLTFSNASGVYNANLWYVDADNGATLTTAGTLDNIGEIVRSSGLGNLIVAGNLVNRQLITTGSLDVQSGSSLSFPGSFNLTNNGTLRIRSSAGVNLGSKNYVQSAPGSRATIDSGGALGAARYQISAGTFTATGGAITDIDVSNGTAQLGGTLTGSLTLSGNGVVQLGSNTGPAKLLVTGTFAQTGGTLLTPVVDDDNNPGVAHGALEVIGSYSLSGPSRLAIAQGFGTTVVDNEVHDVIVGAGVGDFATVTGTPNNTGGAAWAVDYDRGGGSNNGQQIRIQADLPLVPPTLPTNPTTPTNPSTPTTPSGETPVPQDPASKGLGYYMVDNAGKIFNFGAADNYGSIATTVLNAPVVGLSTTASGNGYFSVASDGGVFAFGDATFAGSAANNTLAKPMVAITANPTGAGYWTAASDGGVFSFGGSQFYGSTATLPLNQAVVDIAPTPSGNGYYLVAADGGVFAFGDAKFAGSTGAQKINAPIVDIAVDPDGSGYWLVAADGGVFAFDAPFLGSAGATPLNSPVVSMQARSNGEGYYLFAADGGVFTFGDAPFYGVPGTVTKPIVN